MFGTVYSSFHEDGDLFGGGEVLTKELLGLKHLEVLDFTLRSVHALQIILSSNKLRSCTRALVLIRFKDSKSIDVTALADLKHLNTLRFPKCEELEELKIDFTAEIVQNSPQPFVFRSLQEVTVTFCFMLKDLTFLVLAPNLKCLSLFNCAAMEEIVSVGKFADLPEMVRNTSSPFEKLLRLELALLRNLNSICRKPLPFPYLKEIKVDRCSKLRKLPLDSSSALEHTIVIRGDVDWWRGLQWEDEGTEIAFLPCFKPI